MIYIYICDGTVTIIPQVDGIVPHGCREKVLPIND